MSGLILFDVMDTLVHDPFFVEVPAFLGLSRKEIAAAKNPDSWIQFECGRISEDDYLKTFFADGRDFDHRGLIDCLRSSYRWLDGMEELVAELYERNHEMHALSNYPIWYRMIEEKLALTRYVLWTFVSCRTTVRKPAPEAFLGAASSLGASPAECLFVDDRAINCEAAVAAGMDAVRFTGAGSLREELKRRGLL